MSEAAAQKAFREAVVEYRKARGLTQRDLADRLTRSGIAMPQSTLAKVERGSREPKLDEAVAIARLLGFSLDDELDTDEGAEALAVQSVNIHSFTAREALENLTRSYIDLIETIESVRGVSVGEAVDEAAALSVESIERDGLERKRVNVTDESVRDSVTVLIDLVSRDVVRLNRRGDA